MADTGNERTGDEELRRRQAEIPDVMRLLGADAQIMETIRDMVGVAGEELHALTRPRGRASRDVRMPRWPTTRNSRIAYVT
jgi:hypothetical protein